MHARCGAWQAGSASDQGAIEFRLFFPAGVDPHLVDITVVGSFQSALGGQDWHVPDGLPLVRHQSGAEGDVWEATSGVVPAGFYEYRYAVTFDDGTQRLVSDPCARYGAFGNGNAAVVIGGSQPADNVVRPLLGGRRPLQDLVLYELMIDDFTAEFRAGRAPLDAVTDKLDELVDLGVTGILFMPWTAWNNRDFDWGYDPFQYFAVEARYADAWGDPTEKLSWLKKLISACHDRDVHVIMDGVYNHTGPAFPYPQFYLDPTECPFTDKAFGGQFPGLVDLDFGNACTQQFVLSVCTYWIETFGIDGIRFDNTVNYVVEGDPEHGLPKLLADISQWLDDHDEANFSLTIEHIDESAADVTNRTAADSYWDNALYGAATSGLIDQRLRPELLGALTNARFVEADKVPTSYLSNHDHAQIGWYAAYPQLIDPNSGITGDWWRLQPYVIALFAGTGVPLLPNGQEFGSDDYIPEVDNNTNRRVLPRPVRWKTRNDPIGSTLVALHARLARVRAAQPSLRSKLIHPSSWEGWQTRRDSDGSGLDTDQGIVVFHRWAQLAGGEYDTCIVVLNFSDRDQTVGIDAPSNGSWIDLLDGFATGTNPSWCVQVNDYRAEIAVGAHWGRILNRRS